MGQSSYFYTLIFNTLLLIKLNFYFLLEFLICTGLLWTMLIGGNHRLGYFSFTNIVGNLGYFVLGKMFHHVDVFCIQFFVNLKHEKMAPILHET